ncbi:MAG: S-layer homology domain-containing protein, partial [Pseudoflavonifractor sp.]
YWFANEYATCIESGILSYTELKELNQSGALKKPIAKEDFARYLVRAMQLGAMAENLTTYTLDFTDKATITPGREPYLYLLNMYGIVSGNENKAVQPKSSVTRAVASKMLSESIAFMDKRGTSVEIANYTDYDYVAGTIVTATAGNGGVVVLNLNSDISGSATISIPAGTPIYENSMLVDSALLKAGTYARVCLDQKGAPIDVRLSGSVRTVTGSVVGISDDAILLSVNGTAQTVKYDRFTEVQAGKKTGDRDLIDTAAGYTSAVCRIDQLGHLVAVQFSGGTRKDEGLISGVESRVNGGCTLVVGDFNGQMRRLSVPVSASISINGIAGGTLNTSYIGSYVSLRVSNDDGAVVSAGVDTATQYAQGAIRGTGSSGSVDNITIANVATGKSSTYNMGAKAVLTYDGKPTTY